MFFVPCFRAIPGAPSTAMISNILTRIFGSRNERLLKQYSPAGPRRSTRSSRRWRRCPTTSCARKTAEFKAARRQRRRRSTTCCPRRSPSCARPASARCNMRHFDVQLIGGMALHNGKIAEMRTGEGKTLVATLPAYLNALAGKGVHVVTVNDYLAQRDADWMGRIYRFLGLTVGVNLSQMEHDAKQAAYAADITYGTNNEFGFDYLRDNMVFAAARARAARAQLRDRRRGRLDPDRRGAHAAHHLRPGRRQHRAVLPHERARAEAHAAGRGEGRRRLLGRREGAPGAAVRGGPRARRGHPRRRPGCCPPGSEPVRRRTTSR